MSIAKQIQSLLEPLPGWLGRTETGQKLLRERAKIEAEMEAEAVEKRRQLAGAYSKALRADENDETLATLAKQKIALREKIDVTEKAVRDLRRQLDANEVEALDRRRVLKTEVAVLRNQLIETSPGEIDEFIAEFKRLDEEAARISTQAFDVHESAIPGPHGWLAFSSNTPGIKKRREGIAMAITAVRKLRFSNLSPTELRSEFEKLLKGLPQVNPTRYQRDAKNDLVAVA